MTAPTTFGEPVLYLRKNTCGDVASEVACQGPANQLSAAANAVSVGDDVYVFVDGEFSSSYGMFSLSLNVKLDLGAVCDTTTTWRTCGSGLKCQAGHCAKTQCADGIDNDGDMWIDYPLDPGCTSPDDDSENTDTCRTSPTAATCPQCGNGRDDDGDGFIDYQPPGAMPPGDPGCTDRADPDEGDDCVPAAGQPSVPITDITTSGSADGTTMGTGVFQQMTSGCGSTSGSGPEKVYEYRLAAGKTSLTASTVNAATTFDTVVYIRRGTCTGQEVACNDDFTGLQSTATVMNPTAGVYFIFVDGYSTSAMGNFHLTVTTTP
jgi:hypothetical protein